VCEIACARAPGPIMNEENQESLSEDQEDQAASGSHHVLGLVIAAAVLRIASDVLVPIAIASILTLIASPVSARLERYIGRVLSAVLIVVFAVAFVIGAIYFFTTELSIVSTEVTQYTENIASKVKALRTAGASSFGQIEWTFNRIASEIQGPAPKRSSGKAVVAVPSQSITEQISPIVPLIGGVFGGVFETFLVIVLMFFLLYDRHNLRDRLVRLAARAEVSVASKALDTAGEQISRYLLFYSLINLGFGVAVAVICWAFGLERPELWGALAFFLRFIPYIGAATSGLLPTLVALAIFPGWLHALGILASYVILDQIIAQFVEPFVIGAGVGVSPVALLVSAIFWGWLWGPIGLVLSTPFTVCLKVAGDYIPALGFFSILLGEDDTLEGSHDYYRKLLELDTDGARQVAIRHCDQNGTQQTFSELLLPAMRFAEQERDRRNIVPAGYQMIQEFTAGLVTELGERFSRPRAIPRLRILGLSPPNEPQPMLLTMIIELARVDGNAAICRRPEDSDTPIADLVSRFAPDLILTAWRSREQITEICDLVEPLRSDPSWRPLIGLGTFEEPDRRKLRESGFVAVYDNLNEARRSLRWYGTRRSPERRRSSPAPADPAGSAPQRQAIPTPRD
jgi:predicted PurR-regulated permease PerM